MSIFGKKKQKKRISYDPESQQPALKTSICTGEMVAGFIDVSTGKFHDYELIRNDADLIGFCEGCGVSEEELKRIV